MLAATLFVLLNWIGQDYLAPQATAFVLYLAIVNVVLLAFPGDPRWMPRRLGALLRPEPDESVGVTGRPALLLLGGCIVVGMAMVLSHQLTPGFLVAALALLAICGATRLRLLPIVMGVMFLAWLSYTAKTYWVGHLDVLTNSVGKVGTILDNNVSKRATSTQLERKLVVNGRIALALASWAGAGLSLLVSWWRRRTPIALLCLFVAPFPVIALQPYGGEMALRVCYFTLPAVVILIARLVLPATPRVGAPRVLLLAVPLLALVPMFVTARFGNEAFEAVPTADVRLSRAMYGLVPDGSIVYVASKQGAINTQRIDAVRFRNLPLTNAAAATDEVAKAVGGAGGPHHVYVLLTEAQASSQIVTHGAAKDWMAQLIDELLRTGRYTVRATVRRRHPAGADVAMKGSLLLSPSFGVPLAVAVVIALFWIEYRSVTGQGSSWLMRLSAAMATVVLVVVAIARFVVYS